MNDTLRQILHPAILAVDDEKKDLELVERELHKRCEADYYVVCVSSVGAGLERLRRFEALALSRPDVGFSPRSDGRRTLA